MARFLEAFRRQDTQSPSGEAIPHRDRRTGRGRMRLVTAATLLVALPGVVTATMGEANLPSGVSPSGSPPPTSITRVGGGEIQPAGYVGPDGWCLTVIPKYQGGAREGDRLEAQPCDGSPLQKFEIYEKESGPPQKTTFFIQLSGRSLCIATDVVPHRRDTYTPRLQNSQNGHNPFCVLDGEQSGTFWRLLDGQESPRTLVVPKSLDRTILGKNTVLFRRENLATRTNSPDNPDFYLPPTVPIATGVKPV